MKKVITFFVGCCLLCSVYCFGQKANGQVNDSVYQCDFEPSDSPSDPNELDYWEMNYGRHGEGCPNKWFWGKPGANGGDNGLFVSSDGESNNYTANALTVVSYRSLNLLAGDYEISFDWQAAGWQDTITDIDGLYVCWVPDNEDDSTLIVSYNGPGLDPLVEKYALDFGRGTKK